MTFTDDAILEGATPHQELLEGQTRACSPVETLPAPIPEELKDTQAEELGVPPIPQEANEPDAAEEPMDELAISMATVGEPAEEPDLPYAVGSGRKEESPKWQLPWLAGGNTSHMASDPSWADPTDSG